MRRASLRLIFTALVVLTVTALIQAQASRASPSWQLPNPEPAASPLACHEAEGFQSHEAWAQERRQWNAERPPLPLPWHAWKAMGVVRAEQTFARRYFRSDKQMHCYVGCRITQETDFITAQFAAWEKERRDLTDCSNESHFERLDYTVTVWGAHIGLGSSSASDCLTSCERSF